MDRFARVAKIIKYTTVDGAGLRLSVYFQGCEHRCKGCQNPQTHDPTGGWDMSIAEILEEINNTPYITGVTLSGGDPLYQADVALELCTLIQEHTMLDIVLYTGYTYAEIEERFPKILAVVDYIVDGRFEIENKKPDLYFHGSSNQNYIDVKQTQNAGFIVKKTQYA